MKEFINAILASKISNDHCGAHELLLDIMYDFKELFVILSEYMNLIGGGIYRKNRIVFQEMMKG